MSKRKFKDTKGREYKLRITIPRLRWIRDEIDVDLGKKDTFVALSNNPIDLVNVLYMLVKEQADKHGISDIEFGESMDGDTLHEAWEAFSDAYLSFCPSHQAELLRKLMAAASKTEHLSTLEVEHRLNQLVESYNLGSKSVPSSESKLETIPLKN